MYNGKNIERSKMYLATIDKKTIENPDFLESFIYAKNLGKMIVLFVDNDIRSSICSLIKGIPTERLSLLRYDTKPKLERLLSKTMEMLSKWDNSDFFIFN